MSQKPTSLYLINFLTGMSDGVLLPLLCCIACLCFSDSKPLTITGIGLLSSFAGGIIYAYARYTGEKSEIEHNHPDLSPDEQTKENAMMLKIGIDASLVNQMQREVESEQALWLNEMQQYQMGWNRQDNRRAQKAGLQTGCGFFLGGAIISVIFLIPPDNNMKTAVLLLAVSAVLYSFGWLKGVLLDSKKYQRGFYHLVKGALIYIAAFVLSRIFG